MEVTGLEETLGAWHSGSLPSAVLPSAPPTHSALHGVSLSLPSLETWSLLGPAQAHRTGLSLPPNPGSPLSPITPCHSSPFGEGIISGADSQLNHSQGPRGGGGGGLNRALLLLWEGFCTEMSTGSKQSKQAAPRGRGLPLEATEALDQLIQSRALLVPNRAGQT